MSAKEDLIANFESQIERIQESKRKLDEIPINEIAEAFPVGHWIDSWVHTFEFTLPLDFALIEQVKEFISNTFPGFVLERENRYVWTTGKPSAGHFLEYSNDKDHFSLERTEFQFGFRSVQEGSTCVVQQIGVEERPVFEVVCADGAKEGLG